MLKKTGAGAWVHSYLFLAVAIILFHFVLERFIYRKIKLIYKQINQTKATKKEETYYKYILPQKSIDEVREDVEKWPKKINRRWKC
jgi:two-component system phosphate regulon sensor histidine kinase PhoR